MTRREFEDKAAGSLTIGEEVSISCKKSSLVPKVDFSAGVGWRKPFLFCFWFCYVWN